ncbi:MAG TPA: glycine cleavage system aminomethyltransferase GcvT [Terriglobia bacterium]|nr:glycine cleavage system aminomethyltransferase GcvT [Terriglobia bacterium]
MHAKRTALNETHRRLGARLIPFAGWSMPVEYTGIIAEHNAVRSAAGLFDVSHMGEFEVRGPEALALLQAVTSNDAARIVPGQAQYSALPTPEGGVVDDLLVYCLAPGRYMLVVNAGNIEKDFAWITRHNRFNAEVEDISDRTSLVSLQGPRSLDILQPLADQPLAPVGYYHFVSGVVAGVKALISRTGYTGEDGFELYVPSESAETVWNGLLESGGPFGLLPAGLGARNTLRLEAKMLLYGADMDETTSLLEAGLGWIVRLEKGPFVGRDALERQKLEGPPRALVGFEMLGREIARDGYPVFIAGREVGRVTSGSPSITLKKNIGLAYVPAEYRKIGTRFEVGLRGRRAEAEIVSTPFYKRR